MTHQKVRVERRLYLIPLILVLLVIFLAVLPSLSQSARSLSDPAFLRILYLTLAVAVILFTFGLLGDSEAIIRSGNKFGFEWQLGGSAAGVAIFYLLLSRGLTPYQSLTVHLLKENGAFLGPADGPIEVLIASEAKRAITTLNGEAIFAYLPRSEDWKLHISGGGWKIKGHDPERCLDHDSISHSWGCGTITVSLAEEPTCLTNLSLVVGETAPIRTKLRVLLADFKDDMQEQARNFSVRLNYSDAFIARNLHELPLTVHRRSHELKACDILADIAEQFNLSYREHPIRLYASCSAVYAATASDPRPSEEFRLCSK